MPHRATYDAGRRWPAAAPHGLCQVRHLTAHGRGGHRRRTVHGRSCMRPKDLAVGVGGGATVHTSIAPRTRRSRPSEVRRGGNSRRWQTEGRPPRPACVSTMRVERGSCRSQRGWSRNGVAKRPRPDASATVHDVPCRFRHACRARRSLWAVCSVRRGGRNSAAAAASSPRVLDDDRDAVGKGTGGAESTHRRRPRRGATLDPDRRSSQPSTDSGRIERRPGRAAELGSISNLETDLPRSSHLRLAIGEVRVRRPRRAVRRGSHGRLLSLSGDPPALPDIAGAGWRWSVRQRRGRPGGEPGAGPVVAAQERRPPLVETGTAGPGRFGCGLGRRMAAVTTTRSGRSRGPSPAEGDARRRNGRRSVVGGVLMRGGHLRATGSTGSSGAGGVSACPDPHGRVGRRRSRMRGGMLCECELPGRDRATAVRPIRPPSSGKVLLLATRQGPIPAGMSRKGTAGPVHGCGDLSGKGADGGMTSLPRLLPLFLRLGLPRAGRGLVREAPLSSWVRQVFVRQSIFEQADRPGRRGSNAQRTWPKRLSCSYSGRLLFHRQATSRQQRTKRTATNPYRMISRKTGVERSGAEIRRAGEQTGRRTKKVPVREDVTVTSDGSDPSCAPIGDR